MIFSRILVKSASEATNKMDNILLVINPNERRADVSCESLRIYLTVDLRSSELESRYR
ncbi:unnamed protein product [Musa hybrid cultivar]